MNFRNTTTCIKNETKRITNNASQAKNEYSFCFVPCLMREIINSTLTCQVVVSLVTFIRGKNLYNGDSKESTYNICFVCLFFFP